jgi:hypothetical protein
MLHLDSLIADGGFNKFGSLLQVNAMRKYPAVSANNSGILCLRTEGGALCKVVQYFLLSCLVFLRFDAGIAKSGYLESNG